ncbi:hypothetical protein V498_04837 [Pseudogymnoascus sp. VKM F-4517 (FW-2822)]|nr:hypothetical protein V498_04837 [Pseudogymnoascus sp. VKM F-4517 (FW-2822)]
MNPTASFGPNNSGLEAGTINGSVHTEFHHHAPPGSRTALVGLGGVGKSQLAIEYAYRTRDRSPETWVFWVHASNADRFEQSFRDIANFIKLSGRQNQKANIFQLLRDWLRDERKGEWVLILDNVDDANFLVKAQSTSQDGQTNGIDSGNLQSLVSYLPQCPNGSILITTRSRNTALKLVEQRDTITVGPMGSADALTLFEKKLGGRGNCDDAAELAAALEYMPLAIGFQKSDRKRTSLLNYEGGQLRRDREAKNSIMITWQISFDYIRKIRPSASNLLSLMSFFDRQGIPKESNNNNFVHSDANYSDDEVDDISQSSISDEFEVDILALRNYLFISINLDGTTFEMHGLVQLATQKWLQAHGQQERWRQQFIRNLYAEFPTGEYENWASILYKAAWYALTIGKGVEAEKMSIQAMKVRRRILGREHNDTLDSTAMVGLAYNLRGRWDVAEELFVQVMETCKKKLGADHPSTLSSIANLASKYMN